MKRIMPNPLSSLFFFFLGKSIVTVFSYFLVIYIFLNYQKQYSTILYSTLRIYNNFSFPISLFSTLTPCKNLVTAKVIQENIKPIDAHFYDFPCPWVPFFFFCAEYGFSSSLCRIMTSI